MANNDGLLDFSREENDDQEAQDNLSHTDGRETLKRAFGSGDSSSQEKD